MAQAVVEVPDVAPGTRLTLFAQLLRVTPEERRGPSPAKLPGDWITTRAYPLDPSSGTDVEIGLRRI